MWHSSRRNCILISFSYIQRDKNGVFFLYFKCCNAETYRTIAQNKRFVNIVELYHDIDLNWKRKNNDDIISSVSLTAYCSSPFTSF